MAEETELTQIERELVLQYLRDDNVPLTVTLENKPEMSDADIVDDKTIGTSDESRVPASAIFPVAIPSRQIEVLNQGIILLKNASRTVNPFAGRMVRVQFYFHHLGLYFVTEMKECSQGLAIVVPRVIKRIPDVVSRINYDFTGELSYEVSNSRVAIDCLPLSGYRIFSAPKWDEIDISCQKEAKALIEQFVQNVKTGQSAPVGNGLHLISCARFLTEKRMVVQESVEGRIKPFNMIYMDDKRLVLACLEGTEALDSSMNYTLSLTFTLSENRLLKRKLEIECSVENCFENERMPQIRCYSLKFDQIKEEDLRFLYERLTGKMFDIK